MVYNENMDSMSLPYLTETRRKLHRLAELSGKEYKTQEFVCAELERFGFKPKRIGTGVFCDSGKSGKNVKMIALRADIDALPITENSAVTKVDFCAEGGVMHACGHDGHTANLLNVARIVGAKSDVPIRFIFQFGEEGYGGSVQMIEGGVLDGVDEIYAVHLCPELEIGKVGYCYGGMFAGCIEFDTVTRGKKSHCAFPDEGADAIGSALYVYGAIKAAAERNGLLYNLGKIEGGYARNIISDNCKADYTLRFYDEAKSEDVMMCAARAALAADEKFGTSTDIITREVYPPLINNALCVDKVRLAAGERAESVDPRNTAEDFSNYLNVVPGCMSWLGIRDETHASPLHSDTFGFDERALTVGTELFLKLIEMRKM